ncbi:MAG: glutaminyl-peptide cyclotransferase [Lutibacter sp.]|uniref:glutaminyl-peptide cyclotransferase n=1 Tax=Lutibacter sp. TaxID=1925666 RepID=UPI00185DD036|nr:glutaminyl-peptide cyclotransferase [Lutibacter sp.]MBT8316563.1 glutaminyl-peptide cyclotransferase [Lutibacter sp.]NNJ57423.1 glutaminyl-peptide cyclotransferase [Lutibacter sp.]
MSYKYFLSFFLLVILFSCKSEYTFILNSPNKIQTNQELTISISEKGDQPIDSVQFSIDLKKIESTGNSAKLNVSDFTLGKHTITAIVFYENKTKKVNKPIYFMADSAPDIYTYKIINTYPHDKGAYTQGLEFYNGFLYEGTGRKGSSSIRKVELTTGKIIQQQDLSETYFGEGITIFKNKIYQLTWQSGIGFVYDVETFEKEKEFKYTKSQEGWGLTHNGEKLIKTDGTERIWFLNPETLKEESYIEAYTNTQKVEKLNELEYINGKIYANIWQKNSILIVNPISGKVEGVANLNSLKAEILKEQTLDDSDEVLNGIAFDKENNRIFVTGKHWSKLYEIELIKK